MTIREAGVGLTREGGVGLAGLGLGAGKGLGVGLGLGAGLGSPGPDRTSEVRGGGQAERGLVG
jgi:hypothetical protein